VAGFARETTFMAVYSLCMLTAYRGVGWVQTPPFEHAIFGTKIIQYYFIKACKVVFSSNFSVNKGLFMRACVW